MSYRTNPDRILDNIDRSRSRDMERALSLNDRQARGKDLDSAIPDGDFTTPERLQRIFRLIESAYRKAARRRRRSARSRRDSRRSGTLRTRMPAAM